MAPTVILPYGRSAPLSIKPGVEGTFVRIFISWNMSAQEVSRPLSGRINEWPFAGCFWRGRASAFAQQAIAMPPLTSPNSNGDRTPHRCHRVQSRKNPPSTIVVSQRRWSTDSGQAYGEPIWRIRTYVKPTISPSRSMNRWLWSAA